MILLTLRRDAPEVSDTRQRDLCGSSLPAGPKGHLLAGTPGTATDERVLCGACTRALEGVVHHFGGEVALVLHDRDIGVANKLGLPAAAQTPPTASSEPQVDTRRVRAELQAEVDRLSQSVEGIRAQASRLAALEGAPHA